MQALVVDTETTGTEPAEVIELAWLALGTYSKFSQRFKPAGPITYGAFATHHILPEELEDCEPSQAAALPSSCEYIIGHNIDYDWEALGKPPVKRICTLAMARTFYPELDSHKLGALYYKLRGVGPETRELLKNAHSAATDVAICEDVFTLMLQDKAPTLDRMDFEALWKLSEDCRLPRIITFGKHKGTRIEHLPRDYIGWMLRQPDMDPYVIAAIKKFAGGR